MITKVNGLLVKTSLVLFDLLQQKDRNPYDLGYSERKRVALTSIFAMDTPIVVLDELTAGMDVYEKNLLADALDKLRQERKTVLVITHDMEFVAERIERVIVSKMAGNDSTDRFVKHFTITSYLPRAI